MRVNGVDIHSVAFGPGQVEISYAEERDTDSPNGVMEIRTVIVPASMVEEYLMEVLDATQQLLDASLIAKRAPRSLVR